MLLFLNCSWLFLKSKVLYSIAHRSYAHPSRVPQIIHFIKYYLFCEVPFTTVPMPWSNQKSFQPTHRSACFFQRNLLLINKYIIDITWLDGIWKLKIPQCYPDLNLLSVLPPYPHGRGGVGNVLLLSCYPTDLFFTKPPELLNFPWHILIYEFSSWIFLKFVAYTSLNLSNS